MLLFDHLKLYPMKKILFLSLVCSSNILFAQLQLPNLPQILSNTRYGWGALASNTTGTSNSAFGSFALNKNTTGNYNTAVGASALYNANAFTNVAIGRRAMFNTTSGGGNTAVGTGALHDNTYGLANVAVGEDALKYNVGGNWNTAVGHSAGPGFGNTNLIHATAIGYFAVNTASFQVRIGNDLITDIGGQVSWSTLSDGRFKRDIKEDIAGLDFINKLRPVSYTVDHAALAKARHIPDSVTTRLQAGRRADIRQTGFVAQEVEAIIKKGNYSFNAVVAPQNDNDNYSIRYSEFVVPLVKAVQELTAKLNEQEKQIEALKKQIGVDGGKSLNTLDYPTKGRGAMLHQNAPNPFSTETEIGVSLPDDIQYANLIFYTMEGKQLKVMPLSSRGDFTVKVQVGELSNSNGVCMYALMADGKIIDSKRLLVSGK
jgi:trimeric autotransporter adhesin